jgi:hypothetical protein
MSSKDEWQKYQEALRRGDAKAAAEAFRRYREALKAEGKGSSKPTLVNLSSRRVNYPNAVPVDQIPELMEQNPDFFKLMQKIAGREPK